MHTTHTERGPNARAGPGFALTDIERVCTHGVHEHEFRQAISILYPGIVFPE